LSLKITVANSHMNASFDDSQELKKIKDENEVLKKEREAAKNLYR
jgi:hypothetical protein